MWCDSFLEDSYKEERFRKSRKVTPNVTLPSLSCEYFVFSSLGICVPRQIMLKQSKSCKFSHKDVFEFLRLKAYLHHTKSIWGSREVLVELSFPQLILTLQMSQLLEKKTTEIVLYVLRFSFVRTTNEKFPR